MNYEWKFPPIDLLDEPATRSFNNSEIDKRSKIIEETLKSFGVIADVVGVKAGASVTQFMLNPVKTINVSNIPIINGNLALKLESPTGSVRIEAPISETTLIGVEVPNSKREIVYFKSIIESQPMRNLESKLGVALGEDLSGKVITYEIDKMPHLLMAGATGSGKSNFLHNLLFSIFYKTTPDEVKLILIDPKRVEFLAYDGIPYLLTPVVTDPDKGLSVFSWAVKEMERRIDILSESKVKDINEYNKKVGKNELPPIVIIVDEFGDLVVKDPVEFEKNIVRLAPLARFHGIHVILASSRPSTDSYTGLIKANIPCRAAFQLVNQIDSKVIIDQFGAEKLMGKGDMLFEYPDATTPIRLQVPYISQGEMERVIEFLKCQRKATYNESII